ncbi:MAG TPA: MFS transporter [Pseudonocardiaceae bacterium]|nr:MFS transporter [Pseudonocardiaceae bacterium]
MSTVEVEAQGRNARLYLTGLGVSMFGDTSMALVAAIWVKTLTGDNAAATVVALCIYTPALLGPAAGLLVDRVRRRRLLVVGNGVMAAILAVLALAGGGRRVWLIDLVMVCYGTSMIVLDPAENALFAMLFDDRTRGRLNGLRMSLQEGGKLVAPLVGVGLFTLLGGRSVALLDTVSFLVAAAAIARLRTADPRPAGPRRRCWPELTAGLAHIRDEPTLRRLVTVAGVAMLTGGLTFPAGYALVDSFGRSPAFVAFLTCALGAGSIIAGLLTGRLLRRHDEIALARLGLLNAVAGLLLGCAPWLPVAIAGWFVRGFGLPWILVATFTAAQRLTPDSLWGRVGAAVNVVVLAASPLAYVFGAALADHVGYRVLLLVAAAASAACVVRVAR